MTASGALQEGIDQRQTATGREVVQASRKRLPDVRNALVHHFRVGGQEGYLTVGLYEDGIPGEIFIRMAKEGSTVSGLMDCFATAVSLALQFGVPLSILVAKFSHTRFEPSGWTGVKEIGYAKSLMDYIFRWLALKYLPREKSEGFGDPRAAEGLTEMMPSALLIRPATDENYGRSGDGPACRECGAIMVRSGSCYRCLNCGSTSGCS